MILALAQALEAATSKQVQRSLTRAACLQPAPWRASELPHVHSQDAHDRARVLMTTLERRGATTEDGAEGEQQAAALAPSNEALVAAIRALAKQMRFKQAWEVISSMRPLGCAPCRGSLTHIDSIIPMTMSCWASGLLQVRSDGRFDQICEEWWQRTVAGRC